MKMGIGNKTNAYHGITSTGAQFWNSFPRGVEGDVLPRLQRRLEELKDMLMTPEKSHKTILIQLMLNVFTKYKPRQNRKI